MGFRDWFRAWAAPQRPASVDAKVSSVRPAPRQTDSSIITALMETVLTHNSPVVFGSIATDLQQPLHQLEQFGDQIVPHAKSAILSRASGQSGGPYWWDAASELCKVLSRIGTANASRALLDILEADSRFVEFDRVRADAARCLGTFKDRTLVPRLVAASKLPHSPSLAIKEAILALGGEALQSPEVITEEGRAMEPEKAIAFFEKHRPAVPVWPKEMQRAFYYYFGLQVKMLRGAEAARPYFAAALLADPGPLSAAWSEFGSVPKTSECAAALAANHPLPSLGEASA
jgi:hypothetical protein